MPRRRLTALAAIALLTASTAAVAQTAQPLSLANAPAMSGAAHDTNALDSRNGYGIYIIGAVVIGLLIFGGLELFGGNDNDSNSP